MQAWATYEERREAELERAEELRKKLQALPLVVGETVHVHGVGDGGSGDIKRT